MHLVGMQTMAKTRHAGLDGSFCTVQEVSAAVILVGVSHEVYVELLAPV